MITSLNNPRIKELVQLQKKKKKRDEQKRFLVEGIRMSKEVQENDLEKMFMSERFYEKHGEELQVPKYKLELVTDEVFEKISDTKTPQGILCVVKQKEYSLKQMMEAENAHILVLDGVQDPGNVGTIFRTAEAAGVTGIIMSKDTVDIYNPKTIRSTMGTIYRMPFVYVEDIKKTLNLLSKSKIHIYAAHLQGKMWYDEVTYNKSIAFLIGNEGNGLSDEVASYADTLIKIPMEGQVESLNVAVASSILMYEASKQRR